MTASPGERWPPVYDLDDLVREIKRLATHPDIATQFYEWRPMGRQRNPTTFARATSFSLASEVPLILGDGQPGTMEHPDGVWLVLGNTCDIERKPEDVRWTQIAPILSIGLETALSASQLTAVRKYTQSRSFFVPPWNDAARGHVHVADFCAPSALTSESSRGRTRAELSWRVPPVPRGSSSTRA